MQLIYDKNGIVIRESREQDIDALSGRLRDADFKEIIAAGHKDQDEALRQSFALSKLRYSVELNHVVVAMFGVVSEGPILAPAGRIWFLGADELGRIKKSFVRLSRQVIAHFLVSYPVLFNAVDSRYVSSITWLKSCGALFSPEPLTLGSVDFYQFYFRRP